MNNTLRKIISLFLITFLLFWNTTFASSGSWVVLNDFQKAIKEKLFIPITNLYKDIILDKQISNYIEQIKLTISWDSRVPLPGEVKAMEEYVWSFFLTDSWKNRYNAITKRMQYLLKYALPWNIIREWGNQKINNPRNGFWNFQLTPPKWKTLCGAKIIPNNIDLWLWAKVYSTPKNLCTGVYELCTTDGGNLTCTCGNKDYWFTKARTLNWVDGFVANDWINLYNKTCIWKNEDFNVFTNAFYPFQLMDWMWFAYNKAGGTGVSIINKAFLWTNTKNGIIEVIKKLYWKDESVILNQILTAYKIERQKQDTILLDLWDPSLNFPLENWQDYQGALLKIGQDLWITGDAVWKILNTYQLAVFHALYNGLGNVWYNFFDNSYNFNLTSNWAKQIWLEGMEFIFWKITKDYSSVTWLDRQDFGATLYSIYYNWEASTLTYILTNIFPKMIEKWMFLKLAKYTF